jgi:FkbM family methyltransferase
MALDLSASLDYTLFFRGCHEPHVAELIESVARPGDVCLDVGANVGAHTLVMATRVGPEGRVIALEPHPVIGARLEKNVALSGHDNVTIVRAALADRDGEVAFFGFEEGAFQQGMSSLFEGEGASRRLTVPAITARTLVERAGTERLDMVKIDVEGAEAIVLEQLAPWIERARPHVIFEHRAHHWGNASWSLTEVLAWLRGLGYGIEVVKKHGRSPLVGAPPESCELSCAPRDRTE